MSAAKPPVKRVTVKMIVKFPDGTLGGHQVAFEVGPTTTLMEMHPLLDWFTERIKPWLS